MTKNVFFTDGQRQKKFAIVELTSLVISLHTCGKSNIHIEKPLFVLQLCIFLWKSGFPTLFFVKFMLEIDILVHFLYVMQSLFVLVLLNNKNPVLPILLCQCHIFIIFRSNYSCYSDQKQDTNMSWLSAVFMTRYYPLTGYRALLRGLMLRYFFSANFNNKNKLYLKLLFLCWDGWMSLCKSFTFPMWCMHRDAMWKPCFIALPKHEIWLSLQSVPLKNQAKLMQ